jgi:hypothetical protein
LRVCEDYIHKRNGQILLPLSNKFSIDHYHTGLCEHLSSMAIDIDRSELSEKIVSREVYKHLESKSSGYLSSDKYIDFIRLVDFEKNNSRYDGPIVSHTLIKIQQLFDRFSIGVNLMKEKTGTNDFNVHGDSLMQILALMPEICDKFLFESDVSKYASLEKLNTIVHKCTLSDSDRKCFISECI